MYNQTSFIALVQQAIKKPLVTVLLPRTSYTWGWRCEYNYVQFLYIGQVILNNYSIASKKQDGDRRWLLSRPTTIYNCISQIQGHSSCVVVSWTVQIRQAVWLLTGFVARCNRNEESQVLAVPGFRKFRYLTAYSLSFRRWQRLQCEAPLLG